MTSSILGRPVVLVFGSCLDPGCSMARQNPRAIIAAQAAKIVRTWWNASERAAQSSDPKV
jgi:hypothetical protein